MTPDAFISRWSSASASERSNSQSFLVELSDLLGVHRPDNTFTNGYSFEFTVTEHHLDGSTSERRIDLYKRGCFVLESKQFQAATPDPTALEQARRRFRRPSPQEKIRARSRHRPMGRRHDPRPRAGRALYPRSSRFRRRGQTVVGVKLEYRPNAYYRVTNESHMPTG